MGLAGTVMKTAGKAAVGGTKVLAKGTSSALNGISNMITNNAINKQYSTTSKPSRVQQAEERLGKYVKDTISMDNIVCTKKHKNDGGFDY